MIFEYTKAQKDHLKNREPRFEEVIERIGMIEREMEPDLYRGVIRQIVGQQISTRAYKTIWEKITALVGQVEPDSFKDLAPETLQSCGLSWRKVDYILDFSRAVANREIDLEKMATLDNEQFIREMVKVRGIGPWSAQMVLIFTLGRQDVISFDDLGIQRGLSRLYQKDSLTPKELEDFVIRVHPYETVASLYLWELAHEEPGRPAKTEKSSTSRAIYQTSLGGLEITCQDNVVTRIGWTDEDDPGIRTKLTDLVFGQLEEYFAGLRTVFDFPYRLEGTPFQLAVWHELEKIPYGVTCSYKDIAKAIGNELAVRAVGGANNKNPIAIVVPCHRVIGANRKLVGYAAGVEIKRRLLDIETEAKMKRGS